MENSGNETPIKKNNKGLVIFLVIVAIAIIAVLGFRFLKPVTPKEVFVSKITATLNHSADKNTAKMDKFNSTVTLSANIETENQEIKPIAEYINNGKITANVQGDIEAKKALVGINLEYQNENLLNGKVFYNNDNENIYVYVKDLFDKYFKINIKQASESMDLSDLFKKESFNFGKAINQKKANEILEKTIMENLKEEYFSKETVDGMKKNVMKLTVGEAKTLVTNIFTSLKNNDNYLKCFEKSDEVKKALEDCLNATKNIKEDVENYSMEIALFTKGSSKNIEKMEIKVVISEDEEGTFVINKVDNDNYEFNVNVKTKQNNMKVNAEALNGSIKKEKVDNNTEKVTLIINDIPDVGKVTLNMELKTEQNTDLNSIDVKDSVDVNNISQSDMITIYSNLMKMKIYSYLAPLMNQGF